MSDLLHGRSKQRRDAARPRPRPDEIARRLREEEEAVELLAAASDALLNGPDASVSVPAILSAIRELMKPPPTTRAIGFTAVLDDGS